MTAAHSIQCDKSKRKAISLRPSVLKPMSSIDLSHSFKQNITNTQKFFKVLFNPNNSIKKPQLQNDITINIQQTKKTLTPTKQYFSIQHIFNISNFHDQKNYEYIILPIFCRIYQ